MQDNIMSDQNIIRKAVIPCAGYGTRFLPATKASPKEMLPIVDKPVIQYVVEEAVASGINEIILITGANKRAIEDHFDYNFELEEVLKRSGKIDQYNEIRAISDMAKFIYVRQKEQLGNGHAVLQAKEVIGDEPFVVVWGDEFHYGNPPRVKQLIDVYNQYGGTVITTAISNDPDAVNKNAIVTGQQVSETITRVDKIVEKPGPVVSPPYLISLGGYVLPPNVFEILEKLQPAKGGEIWLIDAIAELSRSGQVCACNIQNNRYYDCGNKLEYIKANIDMALTRPTMRDQIISYVSQIGGKSNE